MNRFISALGARMLSATALAAGVFGLTATAADATVIAYDNLNTVAKTVNGHTNEDTFSLYFQYFPAGGQIQLGAGLGDVPKELTTQFDVFACEHGVYYLENCLTLKPKKHFSMTWTAGIYSVGPENTVGTLLSSATNTFKFRYRPTTSVSCPATVEGKGFGENCDVGGQKQSFTFKHFSPAAPLPERVIILLSNSCGSCSGVAVNVGLQASFKEYREGEFIEEPAADGGVPAEGSDPLPEDVYTGGALNEGGWAGFQPVFELNVAR